MKLYEKLKEFFCENDAKWQAEREAAAQCACQVDSQKAEIDELKHQLENTATRLLDIQSENESLLERVKVLEYLLSELAKAGKFKKKDKELIDQVEALVGDLINEED